MFFYETVRQSCPLGGLPLKQEYGGRWLSLTDGKQGSIVAAYTCHMSQGFNIA